MMNGVLCFFSALGLFFFLFFTYFLIQQGWSWVKRRWNRHDDLVRSINNLGYDIDRLERLIKKRNKK